MTGAEVTKKLITLISTTTLFFGLSVGISLADTEEAAQIILRVNNLTCSDCHQAIGLRSRSCAACRQVSQLYVGSITWWLDRGYY